MYYSDYAETYLAALSQTLLDASRAAPTWCIFDNTALGFAISNALRVLERVRRPG